MCCDAAVVGCSGYRGYKVATWPSDYTRRTCIYMPVKILVIEHTQIHTYSEFQFHSNLSVSCSVQVRVYICICNSVYKCMQRGDSNAAEIHRIHTCAATKRVEGRAWHLLCTQALPRLTFHCHTVEMGDKVTHTHSHTLTHWWSHTLTQSATHSHAP